MSSAGTKTIIWDLDGTLIDSFGIFSEVLAGVLPKYGLEFPSEQTLRENYHGGLDETIDNVLGGVEPGLLQQLVADFLENQNAHYEVVTHHFFSDALRLAQRAHEAGVYQILVTNRNHEGRMNASPRSIVERSVLRGYIDMIISGDDSEHRKPTPEVLGDLLVANKLMPAQILVVGDQFVDAEFAKNLGTQAVLVNRETDQIAHMEKLGPQRQSYVTIVKSLDEVLL